VEGQFLTGNGDETIQSNPDWHLGRAWVNEYDQTQCHVCGTKTINCCNAGQAVLGHHSYCWDCPVSTYTSRVTLPTLECTACPYASGVQYKGENLISDCVCNQGYGGSSLDNCIECGVGTYVQTTRQAALFAHRALRTLPLPPRVRTSLPALATQVTSESHIQTCHIRVPRGHCATQCWSISPNGRDLQGAHRCEC